MIAININQAFSNIKHHLMRSFLTLLGVLVGTAAVVALLTGSELATENALSQFKKLGVDLISVSFSESGDSQNHSQPDLNTTQLLHFETSHVKEAMPYTLHYSQVIANNIKSDTSVLGVTEQMQSVLRLNTHFGRFISNLDKLAPYCVLGNALALQLSGNTDSLLGEQIKINNYYFTVIGILDPADRNLFLLADPNQAIFISLDMSLQFYKNAKVNHIIFKLKPNKTVLDAQKDIADYFYAINPEIALSFRSPETIIQNMQEQQHTFKLLLGFIGCISLLVGGIGVMNIMLVSVTERRREIGIRMAVGAQKKDILYLFLAEAAILTLLGGVAGILLGEIISLATAKLSHWEFHFILTPILIGFTVSATVGLFFGYYPAVKASQLDPIDILRTA